MPKERLQAFSDGVFAIIITIMVLELKAPHEPTLGALRAVAAPFLGYALSFTSWRSTGTTTTTCSSSQSA